MMAYLLVLESLFVFAVVFPVVFPVVIVFGVDFVRSPRVEVMVMKVLHLVEALVEVMMSAFLVEYMWCLMVVLVVLECPLDYWYWCL